MWRWTLAAILLFAAATARADTTKFTTDCTPGGVITVSGGGLTLTTNATGANGAGCRADSPRFHTSGKYYFEVTWVTAPAATASIGFVDNGDGGPYRVTGDSAFHLASDKVFNNSTLGGVPGYGSVGWSTNGNHLHWKTSSAPTATPLAGQTSGVALDLTSDPPQIWFTPNVLDTHGCGGGPIWNGSAASAPVRNPAGCGGPANGPVTAGTGVSVYLPGYAYYPIFVSNGAANHVTFNFAGRFIGTPPAGFEAWDAGSPTPPNPGFFSPPVPINLANAPGWQANTAYVAGDRVVAGPGWTPGSPGSFASNQPLYLWAANAIGGPYLTGATQPAGFASCASPANFGAGFDGRTPSEWSRATTASDNGITWTCLTPVDYTTMTGLAVDDNVTWAPNTVFHDSQIVVLNGVIYIENVGAYPGTPCTSSAGATSPTNDSGCTWSVVGNVTYRSGAHVWPHQIYLAAPDGPNGSGAEVQFYWPINIVVWYGGLGRQSYYGGHNGETDPIHVMLHHDDFGEAPLFAYHFWNGDYGTGAAGASMTAAPGDSFQDTLINNPSRPLGLVNTANGATFYNNSAYTDWGNFNNNLSSGSGQALGLSDFMGIGSRLQLWSVNGPVLCCGAGFGYGGFVYLDDIVQSDNGVGIGGADTASNVNTIFIYRGNGCPDSSGTSPSTCARGGGPTTATPGAATMNDYPAAAWNNTIIGLGNCPACVAFTDWNVAAGQFGNGGNWPPPYQNNIVMGWKYPWAYREAGRGGVVTGFIDDGSTSPKPSGIPGAVLTIISIQNLITGGPNLPSNIYLQPLIGPGIQAGTIITNNGNQGPGCGGTCTGNWGLGTYQVNNSQLVPSETIEVLPQTNNFGNLSDLPPPTNLGMYGFPDYLKNAFTNNGGDYPLTPHPLPGTTYGIDPNTVFMHWVPPPDSTLDLGSSQAHQQSAPGPPCTFYTRTPRCPRCRKRTSFVPNARSRRTATTPAPSSSPGRRRRHGNRRLGLRGGRRIVTPVETVGSNERVVPIKCSPCKPPTAVHCNKSNT